MQDNYDKYSDTIGDLEYYMNDITNSMFGGKAENEYVIIERPKINDKTGNKSMSFYIASKDGSVKFQIFTSAQTLGIKRLNDDWKTSQYNYSISKKNQTQAIVLGFDDGSTIKKFSEYNPQTQTYKLKKLIESLPAEQIEDFDVALLDEELSDINIHVVNSYSSQKSFMGFPVFGFTRTYEEKDETGKTIRELPLMSYPTLAHIDSPTKDDLTPISRSNQLEKLDNLLVDNTIVRSCSDFVKKMFRMQSKSSNDSNDINNSNLNKPDNHDDEER